MLLVILYVNFGSDKRGKPITLGYLWVLFIYLFFIDDYITNLTDWWCLLASFFFFSSLRGPVGSQYLTLMISSEKGHLPAEKSYAKSPEHLTSDDENVWNCDILFSLLSCQVSSLWCNFFLYSRNSETHKDSMALLFIYEAFWKNTTWINTVQPKEKKDGKVVRIIE